MSAIRQPATVVPIRTDWVGLIKRLGPAFAARAAAHDATDAFVANNYAELKEHGVFTAAIPKEVGGGGADYVEVVEMLRELAHYCGSTALALSMHTHLVATAVWRWRREPQAVEHLLRRVVDERLVLISTGGSDWINGSGTAERVEGGWRITGRKIFGSGVPAGDLLVTGAVYDDPVDGPAVLHFSLPLTADGVEILDTWHVMGMRATGSHDVAINGAFVADGAISARRPQGKWHPLIHTVVLVVFPLVYGVYLGIAEAARELAVARARRKSADPDLCYLVGEMEDALATARLAHADMVAVATALDPGVEASNRMMIGRNLVAGGTLRTVEKAMEIVGGAALYRDVGLERLFRDVQGARYHPLQEKRQHWFAGRVALGLDIDC
jgi:acyl-CoA dehydrogenase